MIRVETVPEILIRTRGNQAEAARIIGCNRGTISKYATDRNASRHAVINGVLMILHTGNKYRGRDHDSN